MFFWENKSKLGIDIGTSSIKAVQLRKEANEYKLETYGVVNVSYQASQNTEFDVLSETAEILKKLLEKIEATTKKVTASLPNNIVFVSVLDMPAMTERELKNAVEWEARRYVPLPIEEVTLSWSVLQEPVVGNQIKVLLTAVPTSVVDNYLKMFKMAGLVPEALEIEALALIRSLVGVKTESLIIIDIGGRNTSLNLVDKGLLRVSRNLPVGGETVTNVIAKSLRVNSTRAEQFKRDLGLSANAKPVPEAIIQVMEIIKKEVAQLIKIYESNSGVVQQILFTGSGSRFPGLMEYFSDLETKVSLGDSLKFISYDKVIKSELTAIGPGLSVAMGLAMRS